MAAARFEWITEILEKSVHKSKQSQIQSTVDDNTADLTEWFKNGDKGSKVYFYEDAGQLNYSHTPPALDGKCVYFVKTTTKPINPKIKSDNSVISGTVSKDALIPLIEICIKDVYSPMIDATEEWKLVSDPSQKAEFMKEGKHLTEMLHSNIENLEATISLPLPGAPYNQLTTQSDFDPIIANADAMSEIHSTVQQWISQIYEFIMDDPAYHIEAFTDVNSGPKEEMNFWNKKCLAFGKAQLKLAQPHYEAIISLLEQEAAEEAARNGGHMDDSMITGGAGSSAVNNGRQTPGDGHSVLGSPTTHEFGAAALSPSGRIGGTASVSPKKKRSQGGTEQGTTGLSGTIGGGGSGGSGTGGALAQTLGHTGHIVSVGSDRSNPYDGYDWSSVTAIGLFKAWQKCEAALKQALDEASDNVKYFKEQAINFELLYTGTRDEIIAGMSSLFNGLNMMFTLSRQYRSSIKLTNLLARVVFQMVQRCKQRVYAGQTAREIWAQPPDQTIKSLEKCLELSKVFRRQFSLVGSLPSSSSSAQGSSSAQQASNNNSTAAVPSSAVEWQFNSALVFERFERFNRRIEKLIDIFLSVHQFGMLESQHIDGLQDIISDFNKLIAELKKKGHDLLDHFSSGFETDFVSFQMQNTELEDKIRLFIDKKFTGGGYSSGNYSGDSDLSGGAGQAGASGSSGTSGMSGGSGTGGGGSGGNAGDSSGDHHDSGMMDSSGVGSANSANVSGSGVGGGSSSSQTSSSSDRYNSANSIKIEGALKLLNTFRLVLQKKSLQRDIDNKYLHMFKLYGKQLDLIKEYFLKNRDNPPLARNMTQAAGCIQWSRQLFRRIDVPMQMFIKNPKVLTQKESHKIVEKYNELSYKLKYFENMYFDAWSLKCDSAKQRLYTSLICKTRSIRHSTNHGSSSSGLGGGGGSAASASSSSGAGGTSGKTRSKDGINSKKHGKKSAMGAGSGAVGGSNSGFGGTGGGSSSSKHADRTAGGGTGVRHFFYANFDRHIFEFIRESKFLKKMGLNIPQSAEIVLKLENRIKSNFIAIKNICEMYNSMVSATSVTLRSILEPHFHELRKRMIPGMKILTWNSVSIDEYINNVKQCIESLWTLIKQVTDILETRVEKNFTYISQLNLLDIPTDMSFEKDHFVIVQQQSIIKIQNILQEKCLEIEHSLDDVIFEIQNFPYQDRNYTKRKQHDSGGGSQGLEFNKVKYYFQNYLYESILNCVKNSLDVLKDRASSSVQKLFLLDTALFEVNLMLQVPNVVLSPSLDEIQETMTNVARAVINTSSALEDWGVNEDGSLKPRQSFFKRLSEDNNVLLLLLLLTGAVEETKEFVKGHLSKYDKFSWLWLQEPADAYLEFTKEDRILQDFIDELNKVVKIEKLIDELPEIESLACFNLKTENLKYQLKHECQRWKFQFSEKLHEEVKYDLELNTEMIKNFRSMLQREVSDFTSLKFVIDTMSDIREVESKIERDFNSIFRRYEVLEKFLPTECMSKVEMDNRAMLNVNWQRLKKEAEQIRDKVNDLQIPYQKTLLDNVKQFTLDIVDFKHDYDHNGPMLNNLSPKEAITRLRKFDREFDTINRKYELYSAGEKLFGLPQTELPVINHMKHEIKLLNMLYDVYDSVLTTMDEYKNIIWTDVINNVEKMQSTVELFTSKCKRLNKEIKQWNQFKDLSKLITDFADILPLLESMSKESMRERHWQEISTLTGTVFDFQNFDELKLKNVLESNILEYREDVEEICEGADKQLRIEHELKKIGQTWENEDFEFASFKNRGEVILKGTIVNEIIEKLEESMANLNQMLTMKHVKPFRTDAEELLICLSDVNDILERWIKLQQLWMSLESVFTSGDIARQMPTDTRVFLKVDKEWTSRFMSKAKESKNVIKCCSNEYVKSILPSMMADLERCQKALDGYLEAKRNKFPRFYFVSNPALLLILSQGTDKVAVQSCFPKVFDSISRVNFDGRDQIVAFQSVSAGYEGTTDVEEIKLNSPVSSSGNIEVWLGELERMMMRTMRREIKRVAKDALINGSDLSDIIKNHCAQCSLLAIQFIWTNQVEESLKLMKQGDKDALKRALQSQNDLLTQLSNMTTENIKRKMDRRNIETLVTIQVHQKDVLEDLVRKFSGKHSNSNSGSSGGSSGGGGGSSDGHSGSRDVNDFEWQKQLRCYWKEDANTCVVQVADVPFNYCWEYLGCKERLVVTPLTDRCYITLTQACGMYFGGAPAGPAGTGKTETVKDLGRALGKYVVVFNCSDQMRYTDTAKIYKGLCQSGSWGCFDEFNRIDLEVLSVVAQQVMAILSAMRARFKTFYFPGDNENEVTLDARCGFFITMNPGYAGRQELPENLKALFRSVAMMVPDAGIIIKVKLASVGYLTFEPLAKKFNTLYGLCKEQLSKQRHYDFGLRNILSVLRTAGANLRKELNAGSSGGMSRPRLEEMIMMRTLRDMNLSKLVGDDVGLFLSLLSDLFPNQSDPPKARYPDVEEKLMECIEKRGLIQHKSWIAKIIQLYETSLVRHGLMMIGPAGGGKSEAIWCLLEALTIVKKKKHIEIRMNPKAMKADEMFGENDTVSGEWTDGVFSSIWSKYNDINKNQITWITCDGPVDAIWIENLNTVLDDNKLLTLANGDRIPMTDNVKILFEAEDLRNASPATVSRAGIIFVDSNDLGTQPLVDAWLKPRKPKEVTVVEKLWKKFIIDGDMFEWLKKKTNLVFPSTHSHLITNFLALYDALLTQAHEKCGNDSNNDVNAGGGGNGGGTNNSNMMITLDDLLYEKLFMYAAAWTLGGLFERKDQIQMSNKLCNLASDECIPDEIASNMIKHAQKSGGNNNNNKEEDDKDEPTLYEYYINLEHSDWEEWKAPEWVYPKRNFKFTQCLIPTRDSMRAEFLLKTMIAQHKPVLVLGASGTGKTSTVFQFCKNMDANRLQKTINFSSATTCRMFQDNIEADIEKKQGKTYGPAGGRKMLCFLDDVSMPEINQWGDQPTLEIVRQLVEFSSFYFLEKDKRGDQKLIRDLDYVGAMSHPGGGRNDIPNRLKRHFFSFNLTPPSTVSIDNIYGQMLRGRYGSWKELLDVIPTITMATIKLWLKVKAKMLPTPSKFHYIFNLFDLSRVFQGLMLPPTDIINGKSKILIDLWIHESERVFMDKLVSLDDQNWYKQAMNDLMIDEFGPEIATNHIVMENNKDNNGLEPVYFADFFREDIIDEETDEIAELAPKIYEPAPSFKAVKNRVELFLEKYNNEPKMKAMPLVLFTDAVKHLMRICRILSMPRGNLLFVGVGGSGRQSLTKLAAYICRHECKQIQLTRNYKTSDLLEDIKQMAILCGKEGKCVTFLITDSDIVNEDFLEYINMMLATGFITGLFPKEERDMMAAEIRPIVKKELGPDFDDTHDTLVKYLLNRIKENFHIVLAFSPANNKFAERARKFPALISGCTIDWFLRWPVDALESVSHKFIMEDSQFNVECTTKEKESLKKYIAQLHDVVVNGCNDYFQQFRRHVYVTPKSYLSFINMYKKIYTEKCNEIDIKAKNVKLGLSKIAKASEDVEKMKTVLAVQKEDLKIAQKNTQEMLGKLEIGAKDAEIQKLQAMQIETECQKTADMIAADKEVANKELQAALPFMEEAIEAANSLDKKDISFVANLPKPHHLIKRIMDCVCILLQAPLVKISMVEIVIKKGDDPVKFVADSYNEYALKMMSSTNFIPTLINFGQVKKDEINEETMELLEPYLEMEDFSPDNAARVASAAAGLCKFVRAMFNYHKASLVVAPRLAALQLKEAELSEANAKLQSAQDSLAKAQGKLDQLTADFEQTMAEKKRLEDTATATENKMIAATNLIGSLDGERKRWTEDEKHFAEEKIRLVGDVAMACAFVSYCGPFNQVFRKIMLDERFYKSCTALKIPVTKNLDVNKFLVDDSTVAEWNSQTLPKDNLSVQNGILTTQATRWPLIIDPQGQAVQWLKNRESEHFPYFGTVVINDPKLRDKLKYAMQEGKPLLCEGIEEELDPMLDPVLEKNFFKSGKTLYIKLGDEDVEFDPNFRLFFITKLSNPHFSPELSAKTTVVDFAVTQRGLEDQLLSRVINFEQRSLEEQRVKLIEEVNSNTIELLKLDKQLLQKLSETEGDLLEDVELIQVLAETKRKALEVNNKIQASKRTELDINKKREQYRDVARRGSVLYFVMVDMALVNWMYQTSLAQYLKWFDYSLAHSKNGTGLMVQQRVENIIDFMTYHIYENVNRSLFGLDKLTFKLLCSLRIAITASILKNDEIQIFLKCGSSLALDKLSKKPFEWLQLSAWANILALSANLDFFSDLPSIIASNEKAWKLWYENETPESIEIPLLQERLSQLTNRTQGFMKMTLVRALRDDRLTMATGDFIADIMGKAYIQPLTVTLEEVFKTSEALTPTILMLTPGADPTQTLKDLARKNGVSVNIVSMGEGQEPHAQKAITDGMTKGDWALLQNCHLGLNFMNALPDNLKKWSEEMSAAKKNMDDDNNNDNLDDVGVGGADDDAAGNKGKTGVHQDFRLWITCEAHPSFPITLLQMSVKVTQEAPQGMKAGLLRSYRTLVDKDRLQRVEKKEWRDLVFVLCFMHSIVQERRKFGPLGWNIPYEFNESDLDASLMFLERHMFASADMSWDTVRYMICEAQYGGRITDDYDRILFNTFGKKWLNHRCCEASEFVFQQLKDFSYIIPRVETVEDYRKYIAGFPDNDSPEMFGLHVNADLSYGSTTSTRILNTILDTQPKESSGGTGKTREEMVKELCGELLEKMPPDYKLEEVRGEIKKRPKHEMDYVLGKKDHRGVDGFSIPLNVFLSQEIIRLQSTMSRVRSTLTNLILAIDGVVIMTPNLQQALDAIYDGKPPKFWYIDPSGATIAWTLPTLSLWFQGLIDREAQLTSWLKNGRPNVYWMTGFFNPQGFLTAMKQEVTRRHKADRWALDDVTLKTTITDEYDFRKIRGPTDDGGVYIRGLFLDGCSWDSKGKTAVLCESKPKELYTPMPIIHVTAVTNKMAEADRLRSKTRIYSCPVYTIPRRTDLNYVFPMDIPSKQPAEHWIMRGVAVLCSKD